jgi:endonuclease III-like uncharacterized protein
MAVSKNKLQDALDAITFKNEQAKKVQQISNDKATMQNSFGKRNEQRNRKSLTESGIQGLGKLNLIKNTLGTQFTK